METKQNRNRWLIGGLIATALAFLVPRRVKNGRRMFRTNGGAFRPGRLISLIGLAGLVRMMRRMRINGRMVRGMGR